LQSITLWATLVFVGALLNPGDFQGGVLNSFTIGTALSILMLVAFQVGMEMALKKRSLDKKMQASGR
jgi:hypothetical protein